jgi:hypothetical protein
MSWQVGVGSFIESSNPLAVINRSEAFNSEYNEPIFDRALGKATFFKCPTFQQPPNSQFSYLTTYVGVAGLGADAASFPKGDRRDGFFGYDRTIRDADVTDGLANTMTIIETQRANGPVTEGGPSTVRGLDPAGGQYVGEGGQFGGFHAGGTCAAFADGSVRFVSDSIDPKTFEALSTIAGGDDASKLNAFSETGP